MKNDLSIAAFDPNPTLAPIQAPGLAGIVNRVELKEQFSVDVRALRESKDGGWIKRLPDVMIGTTVYPRFLVRCQGQHCGIVNRNRRMYPAESTWRPHTLEDAPFMRRIGARRVTGQLEHPPDGRSAMPLGAILVTKVEQPDPQGRVFIEFETLTTELGMVVAHYIMDGVGFGISSRGNGSVIRNAEGIDVVQPDFEPVSFDCVCDESTPGAEVTATQMRLRESRVMLVESAKGDVAAAEKLAVLRTEEAIARSAAAGFAQTPAPKAETTDVAKVAATAAQLAVAAVTAKGAPPLGPSEYLLAMPDGLGHYRAHLNGKNQWDVWMHVHNLPPEEIATNMPTVQNAKQAAENHLHAVMGEALAGGFLMVQGPAGSGVYKALRKRRRGGKPAVEMREGYEVKNVALYTGTMVELVATTDEEADKVCATLEKAGFHVELDEPCVYVHTAYQQGEQAVAHIARVLNAEEIEMRESCRLATVSKGRIVWCEASRKKNKAETAPGLNTAGGEGPSGTFPEAEDPQAARDGRSQADKDDLDGESLDRILGCDHEEPDGDEGPMTINLIVLDPDDLGDLLGGEFDETSGPEDLQTKQSAGNPGSAGVGPEGTTTGASPQGYDAKDKAAPAPKNKGDAMSQSHETSGPEDLQTPQSAGNPGDKGVGVVGAPGGGPPVVPVEGGEGPGAPPGSSGYGAPATPPVVKDIPGGGQYETYEAMRSRHAQEMAGCPYEGYGDMSMRHASEMHSMRERMKRHESVNEAGSGYGTPTTIDDPEDIDLDLDKVKEPKVDLNYESAMAAAKKHAAEAKRLAGLAKTMKKPVTESSLKAPVGAKASTKMPRPAVNGARPAGKVMLYFSEKDEFIEGREFDEKGVLVRAFKAGAPAAPAAASAQPKDESARKAKIAAAAKDVMASLVAEHKPAPTPPAPAATPAPAAPAPAAPAANENEELKKKNRHLTDEVARLESRVRQLEDLVDTMAENQRTSNVKTAVREAVAKHPELEKVRARLESCKKPEDVLNEAQVFLSFGRVQESASAPTTTPPKDGKVIPMPTPAPTPPAPKQESVKPAPATATASASSTTTPDAPAGPVADEPGSDFLGETLRAASSEDASNTSRRVAEARSRREAKLNGKK